MVNGWKLKLNNGKVMAYAKYSNGKNRKVDIYLATKNPEVVIYSNSRITTRKSFRSKQNAKVYAKVYMMKY